MRGRTKYSSNDNKLYLHNLLCNDSHYLSLLFSKKVNFGKCSGDRVFFVRVFVTKNAFFRSSNASSQIRGRGRCQLAIKTHDVYTWHIEFFLLLLLYRNIFGRSRLIRIDDVTVNVFLFTGSYSLILRL